MDGSTVRILRGSPDDTELAALIAVLSAISATPRPPAVESTPQWPRRVVPYRTATSWRALR